MTVLTRTDLTSLLDRDLPPGALLVSTAAAETMLPLTAADREQALEMSAATLGTFGIGPGERVLVSLSNDALVGAHLAAAACRTGAIAASVPPQRRMQVLAAITRLRPTTWITTPTGALDFLARVYIEFAVDPGMLGLDLVLVVGEIPSPGTRDRLATELECEAAELYCEPLSGVALDPLALERHELGDGLAELGVRTTWCTALAHDTVRTGQVWASGTQTLFSHTVGDHVLVRGRWLSLPLLRAALARIDGIGRWHLETRRGDATLDSAELHVAFERPSLIDNPFWIGRLREAITSTMPVTIDLVTTVVEPDEPQPPLVVDHRGHHLGVDRGTLDVPPA